MSSVKTDDSRLNCERSFIKKTSSLESFFESTRPFDLKYMREPVRQCNRSSNINSDDVINTVTENLVWSCSPKWYVCNSKRKHFLHLWLAVTSFQAVTLNMDLTKEQNLESRKHFWFQSLLPLQNCFITCSNHFIHSCTNELILSFLWLISYPVFTEGLQETQSSSDSVLVYDRQLVSGTFGLATPTLPKTSKIFHIIWAVHQPHHFLDCKDGRSHTLSKWPFASIEITCGVVIVNR